MKKQFYLIAAIFGCLHLQAKAQTPMMGWASWNANRININEALIKSAADTLVSKGLDEAGYIYVNTDDGYFGGRNAATGVLQVNSKFPNGMKALAAYIHGKGLKAGIYSEIGRNTCAYSWDNDKINGLNAGLYGHERQDLDSFFTAWNFDFIKVDFCGGETQGLNEETSYSQAGHIIDSLENEVGRELKYNVCRWKFPGTWVTNVADSWRIHGDIADNFASIKNIIADNIYLSAYCSPGHYNDMDMLQLGNGMTAIEQQTHFGMWCIMSSPIMIGCNPSQITPQIFNIISNAEVIALNQDTLGLQAQLIKQNGNTMIFAKDVEQRNANIRAVALYNSGDVAATIRIVFADVQLGGQVRVRNLWEHADLGLFSNYYETNVPAHGTVLLKLTGEKAWAKTVFQGEDAFMNKYSAISLGSNARFSSDANCDGGYKLGWLGNAADNYAEFRKVYCHTADAYTFRVWYMSGENRNLAVSVNGTEKIMTALNSGGYSTMQTADLSVNLSAGQNTIRLSNATGWTPDVDKFELIPASGAIDTLVYNINNSTSELHAPDGNPQIRNVSGGIAVQTPQLAKVAVYNLAGQKIYATKMSGEKNIRLKQGIYIIQINNQSQKITIQ
jgi:hypothetical protein